MSAISEQANICKWAASYVAGSLPTAPIAEDAFAKLVGASETLETLRAALRKVCDATRGAADYGMARKAYEIAARALYERGETVNS